MAAGDPVGRNSAQHAPAPGEEEVTNDDLLGSPDAAAVVAATGVEPEVGEIVQGYELLELLGQGGAGSVFRARHPEHGQVALKILAISKLARARVVRRFRDEAAIASSVKHPTLVVFVELVEQPSPPRLAYAMELVRGISLREKLQHANVLALTEAIHIAKQMCQGVSALHEAGIVHRDLKPENVMLMAPERPGQQTRVKILDFGVAKHTHGPDTNVPAMAEVPGTFVGTPRYMAPEQAAGGEVDGRADLFAIGVMLFEMITGQRPHEGDTLKAVVMAKLKGAPRLTMNPDRELLPQELADTVDACLKLQPDLRPRDARAVMQSLDEAQMVLATVGSMRLDGATKVVRGSTGVGVPPAISRPSIPVPSIPSIPAVASNPSMPPAGALAAPMPVMSQPPVYAPGPAALAMEPQVVVTDAVARRRTVMALAAVAAAMVVLSIGAWVLFLDEEGHVLLSMPQDYASPGARTATGAGAIGGVATASGAAGPAPVVAPVPTQAPPSPVQAPVAPPPGAAHAALDGSMAGRGGGGPAPVSPRPTVSAAPVNAVDVRAIEAPTPAPSARATPAPTPEKAREDARPDASTPRARPAPTPPPLTEVDIGDEVDVEVAPAAPKRKQPPPPPAGEIP